MAAKIYDFPSILENQIRLACATHWTPAEDYRSMFSANQQYLLQQNEWTEEWYVQDDQGRQNYSFYIVKGDFINMEVENGQRKKSLQLELQTLVRKIFAI